MLLDSASKDSREIRLSCAFYLDFVPSLPCDPSNHTVPGTPPDLPTAKIVSIVPVFIKLAQGFVYRSKSQLKNLTLVVWFIFMIHNME